MDHRESQGETQASTDRRVAGGLLIRLEGVMTSRIVGTDISFALLPSLPVTTKSDHILNAGIG
jgi:hypothetical protein